MTADYALVGVGSLAEAIVIGLSKEVDDPPSIVLSPRGAARSSALAERFANVTVAADNQTAVSAARVALICVRPDQADELLTPLTFSPDQDVVSVMAAVTLERLAALTAPAASVTRTIPMPEVARRAGSTPVFPLTPSAVALFERLGGVLEVPDESSFDAMSVATATVSAHLHYVRAIAEWLAVQGVATADAETFVAGIFQGLDVDVAHHTLAELSTAHATPGGFNEGFDRALDEAGVFDAVQSALDANLRRTRGGR